MYSGCEETQCTYCDHLQVCSLKEQFIAAQNAVNRLTVSLGDRAMKDLRDFDWIKKVKLECIHFSEKRPVSREQYESQAVEFVDKWFRPISEDKGPVE